MHLRIFHLQLAENKNAWLNVVDRWCILPWRRRCVETGCRWCMVLSGPCLLCTLSAMPMPWSSLSDKYGLMWLSGSFVQRRRGSFSYIVLEIVCNMRHGPTLSCECKCAVGWTCTSAILYLILWRYYAVHVVVNANRSCSIMLYFPVPIQRFLFLGMDGCWDFFMLNNAGHVHIVLHVDSRWWCKFIRPFTSLDGITPTT